MISMVLLGMILTLLYTSFFQISEGTTKLNEQLAEQQELRLLLNMIVEDLQGAQYFSRFVQDGGAASGLVADTDLVGAEAFSSLRFHANVGARFHRQVEPEADPGMHELAYWVEPDEDDRDVLVLMRREDFYLDDDMDEGGITAELVKGVEAFLVEFLPFANREAEFEDQWEDSWDSADKPASARMPMAIRVTLARRVGTEGRRLEEKLEINLQIALKVGS